MQKVQYLVFAVISVCCLLWVTSVMSAPFPTYWYVDCDVESSGDGTEWGKAFKTIQEGINAAGTGEIVLVADGTYTGASNRNLDFGGTNMTVQSSCGAASTIIDCQELGRGFYFHNGETTDSTVQGFKIINGDASNGGAIYCSGSSPTITGCIIQNNSGTTGAGIYCYDASPVISGCTVFDNGGTWGGGIYCNEDSKPTITGCIISENDAAWSGGIGWVNGSEPTIENCTISENTAWYGAGTYCHGCEGTITNCTITGNETWEGTGQGGGMYVSNSPLTITNVAITGNYSNEGGGIYVTYGYGNPVSFALRNALIADNEASKGGGIYYHWADRTITNCIISGNLATSDGGGIYCYNADAVLDNCILWSNTANASGDEIYTKVQYTTADVVLNYCDYANDTGDIAGDGSVTANNCINTDPKFVNAGSDDYRLKNDSPCIDYGSNSLVPEDVTTDLAGNTRIEDGTYVDQGPYEYQGINYMADTISPTHPLKGEKATFSVRVKNTGAQDVTLTTSSYFEFTDETETFTAYLTANIEIEAGDFKYLIFTPTLVDEDFAVGDYFPVLYLHNGSTFERDTILPEDVGVQPPDLVLTDEEIVSEDRVYDSITVEDGGNLIIDATDGKLTVQADYIEVQDGGTITIKNKAELIANEADIQSGGTIVAYATSDGPGVGSNGDSGEGGGGAGHVWCGADGKNNPGSAGEAYGNCLPGSKGGDVPGHEGGIGGGAIMLTVYGTATVNGTLDVSGQQGWGAI